MKGDSQWTADGRSADFAIGMKCLAKKDTCTCPSYSYWKTTASTLHLLFMLLFMFMFKFKFIFIFKFMFIFMFMFTPASFLPLTCIVGKQCDWQYRHRYSSPSQCLIRSFRCPSFFWKQSRCSEMSGRCDCSFRHSAKNAEYNNTYDGTFRRPIPIFTRRDWALPSTTVIRETDSVSFSSTLTNDTCSHKRHI